MTPPEFAEPARNIAPAARLFLVGHPAPHLTLHTPQRPDLTHSSAQKAATMPKFTVRVELDQAATSQSTDELASWLHDHQPSISVSAPGRIAVRLTVSGPDMWSAVLTAMVALNNADCTPTAVHITDSEPPQDRPNP